MKPTARVMALAEGAKIGMYTSTDLKWHYASGIERTGLGTLECPRLARWAEENAKAAGSLIGPGGAISTEK